MIKTKKVVGYANLSNGVAYTAENTGDGTVIGISADVRAITETWVLTCTAAALNSGTFSVVGSVSGALADATVAVAYSNAAVAFTIADGAVDWIVGDVIIVTITRDYLETAFDANVGTIQAIVTGDTTSCIFDVTGSLNSVDYSTIDTVTLDAGNLTAGSRLQAATAIDVISSKISFTTLTVTNATVVKVYIL